MINYKGVKQHGFHTTMSYNGVRSHGGGRLTPGKSMTQWESLIGSIKLREPYGDMKNDWFYEMYTKEIQRPYSRLIGYTYMYGGVILIEKIFL